MKKLLLSLFRAKKIKTITALLNIYRTALYGIMREEDINEIRAILYKFNIQFGVCFCADCALNVSIRYSRWVRRNGRPGYWCTPPSMSTTKDNIIGALQIRISILWRELERF